MGAAMIDRAELERDRVAGTPGPWAADENEIFAADVNIVDCWLAGSTIDEFEANIRRVARLPDLEAAHISALDRIAVLEGALREIAGYLRTDELATEYDVECADFEGGYDACIDRARAALDGTADTAAPLSPAARDVLAERRRQVDVEGWTSEHDDTHRDGELALAAACYAMSSAGLARHQFRGWWPWDWAWFKRSPGRRELVKAGALILAEIERRDRHAERIEREAQR